MARKDSETQSPQEIERNIEDLLEQHRRAVHDWLTQRVEDSSTTKSLHRFEAGSRAAVE